MKEYKLQFELHNIYENNVREAFFDLKVMPCNDYSQFVTSSSVTNSFKEATFVFKNLFDFEVHRIRSTSDFKEFRFTLNASIQKSKTVNNNYYFLPSESERGIVSSKNFSIDHHIFLQKLPENGSTSKTLLTLRLKDGERIFDFLIRLNDYVHSGIIFNEKADLNEKTGVDAMLFNAGNWEEFVDNFITMARENKIPARFVTGYLNKGEDLKDAVRLHAWVEAFIPSVGWLGYDPLLNVLTDDNYIKVAHGSDFQDCNPFKFVFKTTGENQSTYKVKLMESKIEQQQQQQKQQ